MPKLSRRRLLEGTVRSGLGIGGVALVAGPNGAIDRVAAGRPGTTELYVGFGHDEWLEYEVHLDAEPEPIYTDDPQDQRYYASNYEVTQRPDGTYLLAGRTGTADPDGPIYGDAYRWTPESGDGILGWEFDVPAGHEDALQLEVDGVAVGVDAYPAIGEAGDETRLAIGFGHDEWLAYEVLLAAEPEPIYAEGPDQDPYYAANYEVTARDDGQYLLSGRTGTADPEGETHGDAFQWTSDAGSGIFGWAFDVPSGREDALQIEVDGEPVTRAEYGSPGMEWLRVFDDRQGRVRSVIGTRDGGFLVAGGRRPDPDSESDLWVEKLDADDTTQWRRIEGGDDLDRANAAVQTADGGYVLAGGTWSFGAGESDAWILKLRSGGTPAWRRTLGDARADGANDVAEASGGGCVVAGYSWTRHVRNATVTELDAEGEAVWQRTFGGPENDIARSVIETSDGGYLFAGGTSTFAIGQQDAWVVKLDASGTQEWSQAYGGDSPEGANAVIETSDGGYLAAGHTDTFTSGDRGGWAVKLDDAGRTEWDAAVGGRGRHWFDSVVERSDGGYLLAGSWYDPDVDTRHAWLVELDSDGQEVWSDVYGGGLRDVARTVAEPADGEYLFAGSTWSFGVHDARNAWVARVVR